MGLGSSLKKAVGKATRGSLAIGTGGLSELARKKRKGGSKAAPAGPQSYRITDQAVEQVDYKKPKNFKVRYPGLSMFSRSNAFQPTPEMQELLDKYRTEVY